MNRFLMTPLLVGVAASILSAQESPRVRGTAPATAESTAGSAARCKASDLIGCEITNSKNESLGEIQDIVLDGGSQRIAYVVVAFGGFLGMGEKYFAMPWRLVEVTQRSPGEKLRAKLGLDKETLKAAPGFDEDKWPDMANQAWTAQVDTYYRSREESPREEGAPEPKGSGADGKRGVDREPGSKAFAHRRLTHLIGMGVVDAQRESLADIEDLVVDTTTAKIDAALLSFGGTLGIGEKLALVPTEALTIDVEKNVFVFPCTTARLEAMALPSGEWPALNSDQWLTRSRELCAKASADKVVTDGDVIAVDASGTKAVPFADTYDVDKVETVTGTITTVGSVRIGDRREERVRLRIRTAEGREVIVYAAPEAHADQRALELRTGTIVEVSGSPARYGSQTVIVAGSIAVDGKSVKLRDDQGRPTWQKN